MILQMKAEAWRVETNSLNKYVFASYLVLVDTMLNAGHIMIDKTNVTSLSWILKFRGGNRH